MNVCFSTQVPYQLSAATSHSNCSSHKHAPHATENLFSIDRLFYGSHSRMTCNHSRIVNHFAMLSRNTTNHINMPQQKTFTYHSPLPFLSLQIVCPHTRLCHFSRNYFLTTYRWRPPRSGFFPVGESLNIINSINSIQWDPFAVKGGAHFSVVRTSACNRPFTGNKTAWETSLSAAVSPNLEPGPSALRTVARWLLRTLPWDV